LTWAELALDAAEVATESARSADADRFIAAIERGTNITQADQLDIGATRIGGGIDETHRSSSPCYGQQARSQWTLAG
jgi:hypothetical protein